MTRIDNSQVRKHIHRNMKKYNWLCSKCGRLYPDHMTHCPRCNVKRGDND